MLLPRFGFAAEPRARLQRTRLCLKTQEAGREATPSVPSPPNCSRFFSLPPRRKFLASNLGERVG
jgi:hypothetical protein